MYQDGQHRGRGPVIRRLLRGSEWRREVLRTNLWLVPAVEVVAAVILFVITYALDRAVYDHVFAVPGWAISGSADVARTILTAIAAAVITVIGVVFSIVIVALTLTSTQFGPRMLRNFIRDRGTQLTLGTYVATFVYAVLTLGSVGQGTHGPFVPHISVTMTLVLMLADLAVLIYFLHHIAVQIQLPQVIAGIAGDLQQAIELQAGHQAEGADLELAAAVIANMSGRGGVVAAPRSGYLQYIEHSELVTIASEVGAVIHVLYRPGHFIVQGNQYASVSAGRGCRSGGTRAGPGSRHRPVPDARAGCLVRGRPARRDCDPRAVVGRQRHLHGADLHRLDRGQPVQGHRAVAADQAVPGLGG